jgi:hypothetical protein
LSNNPEIELDPNMTVLWDVILSVNANVMNAFSTTETIDITVYR